MNPKVTFIVPCYNLAHLMPECVNSILSQTYGDYEILIMDDCSPDNTPAVARGFSDSRIRHIRNETNLGNVRNYNKGIQLARGEYLWVISADDRLRQPYILERYVACLDAHPRVGFAFCPGIKLQAGREAGILGFSSHGSRDAIFPGHAFLRKLLKGCYVVAPSAMARKSCYIDAGLFPDLPYACDWYIWCAIALHNDVAYFAEPMVNYRYHDRNLTTILELRDPRILFSDDFSVLWRIKEEAKSCHYKSLVKRCHLAIAERYARELFFSRRGITLLETEVSIHQHARTPREAARVGALLSTCRGNYSYSHGDFPSALAHYSQAIREAPTILDPWARYLLLRMGTPGIRLRNGLSALLHAVKQIAARSYATSRTPAPDRV